MKVDKTTAAPVRHWPFAAGLLGLILAFLFFGSFRAGYVHFANDGPLGQQQASWGRLPQAMTGMWDDLNYIGFSGGAFSPGVTGVLKWMLGPVGFLKFYAPVALFIMGFGAWTFFNQLRLSRTAAVLGALGVGLNSAYFSTACWGVASQQIAYGFDFMALALVVSVRPEMPLLIRAARIILAGLAVGMNVMEAADIGALMSTFVAAFVVYHAWVTSEGGAVGRVARGAGRIVLIAVSAAFISAFALSSLIGTQIKGVAGTQQDEATKLAHWDFATQWSLPKRETLALIIPGLYGFRMDGGDNPGSANYWGIGGRDPAWQRYLENGKQGPAPDPRGLRQAGGGCYMGVTAVLLAFWAVFQSFRNQSLFTAVDRKLIWFWAAALVVSLLLAYGRFAPFFQYVYAIPYVSTVRNPGKFLVIFIFSMTVLTAYGVHGLCRGYLEIPLAHINGLGARLRNWWSKASVFDRRWTVGCLIVVGMSLAGWMIYASSQHSLEQYLNGVGFDENIAPNIAAFSIRQVGWYVLFLSLGVGLITLILSGALAGRRAKAGGILLGLLLVADLGRADLPWVKYVDYKEKYATNQIIEMLREKSYEHRVAILPFRAPPELALLNELYALEWAQHHFPYYDIQSLDVIQEPRVPQDKAIFESALIGDGGTNTTYYPRRWVLTNTRYLLGSRYLSVNPPVETVDVLNQQIDPLKHRFRIAASFDIVLRPGAGQFHQRLEELTAVINPNGAGQYALFEFTGALPRAKLYSQWQVSTNDQAALKALGSKAFDPEETVLVAGGVPMVTTTVATNQNSGSVEFVGYAPKDIKLQTKSDAVSVLLLNDKYDPGWQVRVDDKPAELLRCNFLMRGVQLPAGAHTVEFLFEPDVRTLYVSLAAIALGVLLMGVVAFHAKSKHP